VSVRLAAPDEPAVAEAFALYMRDIVGRYFGRQATDAEVAAAVAEYDEDLSGDAGAVWVAVIGSVLAGCVGVRWLDGGLAGEVTRMFVTPEARRRGVARALMAALEARARDRGVARLRLDTRDDLVEARALYASLGFVEAEPHNDAPYAEHWFVRELGPG
jgi:GNAT superfamily N-acetyltransferase